MCCLRASLKVIKFLCGIGSYTLHLALQRLKLSLAYSLIENFTLCDFQMTFNRTTLVGSRSRSREKEALQHMVIKLWRSLVGFPHTWYKAKREEKREGWRIFLTLSAIVCLLTCSLRGTGKNREHATETRSRLHFNYNYVKQCNKKMCNLRQTRDREPRRNSDSAATDCNGLRQRLVDNCVRRRDKQLESEHFL